jgi:excinuclease ABC subunit B
MGRAARHIEGRAIMYADETTDSMKRAISEIKRRRNIQKNYNQKYHITPKGIKKKISLGIEFGQRKRKELEKEKIEKITREIPKDERLRLIKELKQKMEISAKNLEFEKAALFRDQINTLREVKQKKNHH